MNHGGAARAERRDKSPSGLLSGFEPVRTERLYVRPAVRGDHAAVVALWSDPSFKRMLPNKLYDGLAPEPSYLASAASSIIRHGCLLVVEDAGGRVVGSVNVQVNAVGSWDVGWYVHPAVRGMGYAAEAVRAALDGMFESGFHAVRAWMFADNEASARLARSLGFQEREGCERDRLVFVCEAPAPTPGAAAVRR